MKFPNLKNRYRTLLPLLVSATVAQPTFAQVLMEEIMVTAQKREQNLQDVGISVTAFSGDQISSLGYTNTTDIAAQTPSLNITQFHPTITTVNIRGISQNDFADHLEPPVAMYIDEAYVSSMGAAHMQMFDLERVEVLRGPQGTLFGRNATGGLLHFISRKPGDAFNAFVDLTIAEHNQTKFEGAIGGPVSDRHSLRLAVASNVHDGYVDNRVGSDLRDSETYAIRGQWLFKATDDLDFLLRANHSTDNSTGGGFDHAATVFGANGLGRLVGENELASFADFIDGSFTTCPGCDAFGYKEPDNDVFSGSFDEEGKFDREITGVNLKITWQFEHFSITSISDYLTMDKDYLEDTESSPFQQVNFNTQQDFDQFSQEIRLSGESENSRWIAGLYYLDIDNNTRSGAAPQDIGPFVGAPPGLVLFETSQTSEVTTESWAVFSHLEYDITAQWSLIGAVRYTEDDREIDYTLVDNFGTVQRFNTNPFSEAEQSYENISFKAEIDWRPNEDWLIFASYNRGHKAGNFSTPFIGPVDLSSLPHDEEVLTSFELGFKATLWNGRAQLNANVFHYEYDDYQASFFVDLAQTIRNLDASVDGAEIELVLSPTDRLEFLFGLSLLDTEAEKVGMPDGTFQDRVLPYSPDYSVNGLIRYTLPLNGANNMVFQADFNHSDDFCFTAVCHPFEEEDAYTVGNLRISYEQDDRWSIAAFVRNVSDEEYQVFGIDSSAIGFSQQAFSAPRWAGVELRYSWQ